MNEFEKGLLTYFSEDDLARIAKVKVGIAGAGGLGSNCAQMLVRSGFKKLALLDCDRVEASNLNRQFYFADQIGMEKTLALRENLLRINSALEVECFNERLTTSNADGFFRECDVVIEAFDRADSKAVLSAHYAKKAKLFVCASGLAGYGNADAIVTRKISEGFIAVGDFKSGVENGLHPYAPMVNTAAAKEADAVLSAVLRGEIE